jgi:hypothetical protein
MQTPSRQEKSKGRKSFSPLHFSQNQPATVFDREQAAPGRDVVEIAAITAEAALEDNK